MPPLTRNKNVVFTTIICGENHVLLIIGNDVDSSKYSDGLGVSTVPESILFLASQIGKFFQTVKAFEDLRQVKGQHGLQCCSVSGAECYVTSRCRVATVRRNNEV